MRVSHRMSLRQASCLLASGLACAVLAGPAAGDADEAATNPLGGGASVTLEPVPAPAPPEARRQRVVFVCRDSGVAEYSDRPCGPATPWRSLEIPEPASGAAATTLPPAPRASTRPHVERHVDSAPISAVPTRCAALQRQLDEIDARMRAGYSAREAARLWNRWRDVKSRLHTERC